MTNTVIFAGGFGLPYRNASGARVIGLARLFQSIGYEVLVLGKFPDKTKTVEAVDTEIDGVRCLDIRKPFPGHEYKTYVKSAEAISAVLDELGARKVRAIIAYNYPARGAIAIIKECRSRGIAPILDCTEWYGWEGRKIARNLLRLLGTEVRMRILTRVASNIICASSFLEARFPKQNTFKLPWIVDAQNPRWQPSKGSEVFQSSVRRFLYAGSPGIGLHKDRLPVAIQGFHNLHQDNYDFVFNVAGLNKKQYLKVIPNHEGAVEDLGGKLRFLGRIPHCDSLTQLRASDFAVFFRRSNRMSNTGFPTKYVEAASLGIPVITNPTSDIGNYLTDGNNGFLAPDISIESIRSTLRRAICLDKSEMQIMKDNCAAHNPFELKWWQQPARDFMQNLRVTK